MNNTQETQPSLRAVTVKVNITACKMTMFDAREVLAAELTRIAEMIDGDGDTFSESGNMGLADYGGWEINDPWEEPTPPPASVGEIEIITDVVTMPRADYDAAIQRAITAATAEKDRELAKLREDKENEWLADTAKGEVEWELIREIQCTDGVPENIRRLANLVERVKSGKPRSPTCEHRRLKPARYLSARNPTGESYQRCGRKAVYTDEYGRNLCKQCAGVVTPVATRGGRKGRTK